MIELEMEGFTLKVPLKPTMTIDEFMHVVERVEKLAAPMLTAQAPRQLSLEEPEPLPAHHHHTSPEDFRLPHEDQVRVQHLMNQVKAQMEYIKRHDDSIARHDKHLEQILTYLQSLDKMLRR